MLVLVAVILLVITRSYNITAPLIFDKFFNTIYRKITYIDIIGNNIIPTDDIVTSLYNTNVRDQFILKDKKQIIESLRQNEMIEDILLKISLPNKLVIIIKERDPLLAYHNQYRKIKYIDVNFHEFETKYLQPKDFIYFRGKYVKDMVQQFFQTLQQYKTIYNNITEVENFADYRFNIVLNNKLHVLLPEYEPEKALQILQKYILQYDILHTTVHRIDFRSNGKIYISFNKSTTKYIPEPIRIVLYKKPDEYEQYRKIINSAISRLHI